jgi:hypothetical protein
VVLGSVGGNVWVLVGREVTTEEVVDVVPSEVPFPGVGSRVGIEVGVEVVLDPVAIGELVVVESTVGIGRSMLDVGVKVEEVKEVGIRGRVPFVSAGSGVSVVKVGMLDKILVRIGALVTLVEVVLLTGTSGLSVGNAEGARVEDVEVPEALDASVVSFLMLGTPVAVGGMFSNGLVVYPVLVVVELAISVTGKGV